MDILLVHLLRALEDGDLNRAAEVEGFLWADRAEMEVNKVNYIQLLEVGEEAAEVAQVLVMLCMIRMEMEPLAVEV
jgi:hypothetical protein